ncbi:hypothetical protein EJB05_31975 [Eragrostis curvula]|uniref:Large ribosomal subunit protein uL22c n=1 Tax=Eragrostis curvula TaxID=38414 RepID=A0A5J9UGF9_9POAL|nr:hypothetical protein EJB05_31975 [Eragrostis curvula]
MYSVLRRAAPLRRRAVSTLEATLLQLQQPAALGEIVPRPPQLPTAAMWFHSSPAWLGLRETGASGAAARLGLGAEVGSSGKGITKLFPIRGISTTRLLAADDAMVPISSPLTPPSGDAEETDKSGAVVKKLKVQAIKKDIKQSPKKVNLVAKLVRGMRVEDALLQLQVTVKRAAKTVYQVIHSARANASHNHGLDPDKLIVEEAFVGKGLYLKRLSYHAKGRCGVMVRPRCRLTVVVREATAEEEAKIAKLRVSNYKKLTRKERQLMPHRLIEVSPRWARKRKEAAATA